MENKYLELIYYNDFNFAYKDDFFIKSIKFESNEINIREYERNEICLCHCSDEHECVYSLITRKYCILCNKRAMKYLVADNSSRRIFKKDLKDRFVSFNIIHFSNIFSLIKNNMLNFEIYDVIIF